MQIPEARQYARAFQKRLTTDTTNQNEVMTTFEQMAKASRCLIIIKGIEHGYFVETKTILNKLKSIMTNTKERLIAHFKFSEALDGKLLSTASGDTCNE